MKNANNGYDGYSMSNRAVEAYKNGEMPLSKWTKKAILAAIEQEYPNLYSQFDFKKLSTESLKSLLTKTSWHHTSKFFNKTDFFSLSDLSDFKKKDYNYLIKNQNINKWLKAVIINFGDDRGDITIRNSNFNTSKKHPDFTLGKEEAHLSPYQIVFSTLDLERSLNGRYVNEKDEIKYFCEIK